MSLAWLNDPVKVLDQHSEQEALQRQVQLTKPPGSLGRLENLAIRLAAMQGVPEPQVTNIQISVFAADHGVAAENVSAFPQVVTTEMVRNFARGGAAISVLARQLGARLEVVDLGTANAPGPLEGVIEARIAAGTANFARQVAMTDEQLVMAMQTGRESVLRATAQKTHVYIGGEMGIANTTSAAAVAAAILELPAAELAGPGTGLDDKGIAHKAGVIDAAITLHKPAMDDAIGVLRCLGGFEIAALTGAYISAAQQGLAVIVDGYISCVAALLAQSICTDASQWWFYSHQSAEPGHAVVLKALNASPLLELGMRLGEGSGAAVSVSLLQQACVLHNEMATFTQAGVSNSE